jgi:hypothetical protein
MKHTKKPEARQRDWVGTMRASITVKTIRFEVRRLGGTIEDDSGGRWHVLQLTAPPCHVWRGERLKHIRVEWPFGESSEPACREAWERITHYAGLPFELMTDDERKFYEE